MIDDFTSIYSTNNQNQQYYQKVHKTKKTKQPYGSVELLINPEPCCANSTSRLDKMDEYADKMRQELTSEDVYTLRFSTSLPVEPAYDPCMPKNQKSYLYDGSLNRPAFEIVSHADVRPATPIKFEEVKELETKPCRKSTKKKCYDDYYGCLADRGEQQQEHDFHCTGFESQSWFENKKSSSNKYSRSHTSPIRPLKLHYGSEQSVRNTGEPVEWQVAGELRTTDWDKLKKYSTKHPNESNSKYERCTNRMYERNQNQPIQGDRYVLSKRFQPGNAKRISLTNTSSHGMELDEENYSEIRHSTLNVNNPFNEAKRRGHGNGEQSKYAANNPRKKNKLLDFDTSETQNKLSFNKISIKKLADSYLMNTTNLNKLNSDRDDEHLSGDGLRGQRKKSTTLSQEDKDEMYISSNYGDQYQYEADDSPKSSLGGDNKPHLLTKIIRDPDTDEILSVKRVKEEASANKNKNKSNQISNGEYEEDNALDRSNISVIDITYANRTSKKGSSDDSDDNELPKLPPPLQFQHLQQQQETSNVSVIDVNRASPTLSSRRSSSNVSVVKMRGERPESSFKKHQSEDFHSANEINLNLDVEMGENFKSSFKRLDELDKSSRFNQSFKELNENFLRESFNKNKAPGQSPKGIIDEIRNFDTGKLKNSGSHKEMQVYEKNLSLLKRNSKDETSSIAQAPVPPNISSIPPPPPPPPALLMSPRKNSEDRVSNAGSTVVMATTSAHLY